MTGHGFGRRRVRAAVRLSETMRAAPAFSNRMIREASRPARGRSASSRRSVQLQAVAGSLWMCVPGLLRSGRAVPLRPVQSVQHRDAPQKQSCSRHSLPRQQAGLPRRPWPCVAPCRCLTSVPRVSSRGRGGHQDACVPTVRPSFQQSSAQVPVSSGQGFVGDGDQVCDASGSGRTRHPVSAGTAALSRVARLQPSCSASDSRSGGTR